MQDKKGLKHWVDYLSQNELPVLTQTAQDLAVLQQNENGLNAHSAADAIARDPIMTVKLLRHLQQHKRSTQTTELVQIEQALLMLGFDSFFNNVSPKPLIEDMLKSQATALTSALRVVDRSHRASEYAKDWAVHLRDLRYEEVRIAALLHDIAEILMWCFASDLMLHICDIQKNDREIQSRSAQVHVLGFELAELQRELINQWNLPEILLTLMNDSGARQPRILNVGLAVNLARHSAQGGDNAALSNDYKEIGELLRMPVEQVMAMVAADTGNVRN